MERKRNHRPTRPKRPEPEHTQLLLFNKPYGVLSQFSKEGDTPTLADYIQMPDLYPAGRLDKDSEGLLLLTNNGALQHKISHPRHKEAKTYWVQVEGTPSPEALEQLCAGVQLKDGLTRPALAQSMPEPHALWPRNPPVRFRKTVTDTWISLTIKEGKNRQVRRMTAAVGHPTLRLIRAAIGPYNLTDLVTGSSRLITLT